MKYKLITISAWMIGFLLISASCSKEKIENQSPDSITVDEIVEFAHQAYMHTAESSADENRAFHTDNDGLIDLYTATLPDFEAKTTENRLIRCLSNLNLEQEQNKPVRRALKAYEQRNERIIRQHRQAYRQMNARVNHARENLLTQFETGEIDRPELARQLKQLRLNYQQALRELKASNAEAFSRSFRLLMTHLNDILTERQWAAFTNCLRS